MHPEIFGGKEDERNLVNVSSIHSLGLGNQAFSFESVLLSNIGLDKDCFSISSKQTSFYKE